MAIGAISGSSYSATSPAYSAGRGQASAGPAEALTPEQQRQVEKLRQTDQRVRAHEQAHLAAAGGLAVSGASFQYSQGPDGKRYAVAGAVSIDASEGRTPEDTIRKADQIRRAALAPADPSPQDHAVAAAAGQMQLQAQLELARVRAQETSSGEGGKKTATQNGTQGAEHFQSRQAIAAYREPPETAPSPGISLYA